MPRSTRPLLALALVGGFAFAACGGDDGSTDAAAGASTTSIAAPNTATAGTSVIHGNLAYATTSKSQVLDLWLPSGAASATPLVIYVHGGAFSGGERSVVGDKVQPLLDAGFAVASVDYRLSGEAIFPAAPQDLKAAVRWLRANAATYNLDPDKFATWGESAGGNLVAVLGTSGDQTSVLDDPSLGNADVSSAVQAVVDWYGPTDFLQMDTEAATPGNKCTAPLSHDTADSPESLYIGAAVQTAPEKVAPSNPITYIATAKTLPAFSIAHGDADCEVPYQQSQILAHALNAAGASPELTIIPDAEHDDAKFDTLVVPTIAWLQRVLQS